MTQGYLSDYFVSIAAKRLSAVEADPSRSHQHEFNGTRELKRVLGTGIDEQDTFDTKFIWLGEVNEGISNEGSVTWYDARLNHPTRSEYRLYFPTNDVTDIAKEGDMLFIAKRTDDSLMIIITAANSTVENQLLWLFGLPLQLGLSFESKELEQKEVEIDFIVRFIFDELGIEIEEPETDYLDELLKQFKGVFPTTKLFSEYARKTVPVEISAIEAPDETLMAWMNHEERLFRRLERHIVSKRLMDGFTDGEETDVDGFLKFSLSIQNRRKSRAGYALEHHLEEIFIQSSLLYSRGEVTENKSKPDFLFPSIDAYRNAKFPAPLLTMLGAKTTCKDRWRQVLPEAARIENKHLITLEPGISENQTNEMQAHSLQLVVPSQLLTTYNEGQQGWLMNLKEFVKLVAKKQAEQ